MKQPPLKQYPRFHNVPDHLRREKGPTDWFLPWSLTLLSLSRRQLSESFANIIISFSESGAHLLEFTVSYSSSFAFSPTLTGATNHVSSPDGGASSNGGIHHGLQSTSILAAAQSLAMSLQQQTPTLQPSPDPITAGIISTWLDTHLPVSEDLTLGWNGTNRLKALKQL